MFLIEKNAKAREKAKLEPKFLTKAHQENYEKGMKQIAEWKKTPSTLEEMLAKLRKDTAKV